MVHELEELDEDLLKVFKEDILKFKLPDSATTHRAFFPSQNVLRPQDNRRCQALKNLLKSEKLFLEKTKNQFLNIKQEQ